MLTSSRTQQEWVGCNGSLWINVTFGECRCCMASEDAVSVPLNVYTGLGNCSGVFGSSPPISDGRLTLVGDTPRHHAACWLARFYGPQAAPTMTARPLHVQLGGAGPVKLVADLFDSGSGQLIATPTQTLIRSHGLLRAGRSIWRVLRSSCMVLSL